VRYRKKARSAERSGCMREMVAGTVGWGGRWLRSADGEPVRAEEKGWQREVLSKVP